MNHMVGIILISLVLAGLAGIVLFKVCRRRPASDTGKGEQHGSTPTIYQGFAGATAGDSPSDSQTGTTNRDPNEIHQLSREASPPESASSPAAPSVEVSGVVSANAAVQPLQPLAENTAELYVEVEPPDPVSGSCESPAGTSAQPVEPEAFTPETDAATAERGQVDPAVEQVSSGDSENVPPKEEGVTRLTHVSSPIEAATEGSMSPTSSSVSTTVDTVPAACKDILPEAEPGSAHAVLVAAVDGGDHTLPPAPSKDECEGAPEPEQVSEHVDDSGSTANGVMPECAPEPALDEQQATHPVVAATDDFCDKPECEAGDSQSADGDVEVDVVGASWTGTATHQAEHEDGPPDADEPAEDLEDRGSMVPQAAGSLEPSEKPEGTRSPRVYRPTPRAPSQVSNPRQTDGTGAGSRNRAMRVEVRVRFERGGFCLVSLLPQRDDALPAEIEVKGEGDPPALLALYGEWCQDVSLASISDVLERGLVWQAKDKGLGTVRWNLSGRDIFVLGRSNDLSGYITIPRLLLGEEHVVLCREARLPAVLEALCAAGSPEPAALHADLGAPRGWVVLRGVTPKSPVSSSTEGDILDSLRPLADVEIVLLDGIRLTRTTWLAGYPPRIHLRGSASETEDVRIDGQPAVRNTDGNYEADRWDASGMHEVWCPSVSKSYTIQEGPEHWDAWDAYDWSLGEPTDVRPAVPAAICGMLVRPHDDRARERNAVTVPATNCVLIGSTPGEIYVCRPRAELRISTHVAFPWFAPAWALPPDSMRCDKRANRVIPMGCGEHTAPSIALGARGRTEYVLAWCRAILDANLKGLAVEPADDGAKRLWREYKLAARTIWRGRR